MHSVPYGFWLEDQIIQVTVLVICRAMSFESSLNEAHYNNSNLTPFSSKKKSKKLGGSFEKMINLLTPKKSSKSSKDEPKKIKVCILSLIHL